MQRRNHPHVLTLVLVPAMALLAASCGAAPDESPAPKAPPSASGSKPAAPAVDACALITKAEAEAALGKPVGDPVPERVPPVFSCAYQAASGFDRISISVVVYGDARQAADAHLLAIKVNNYAEVSGIGDRAYRSLISDLTVLKGRYEVSADLNTSADNETEFQKAKDVAARALTRLQ